MLAPRDRVFRCIIASYEKITKTILKKAPSKEEFIKKVNEAIMGLPDAHKEIFNMFIQSIQ